MMRACPEIARRVGARIRELRIDAEISQGELARRIYSHRPVITRIERGAHVPHLEEVDRIARALELDAATVLVCLDADWQQADLVNVRAH